jgi:hypothetical protein
MEPNVKVFYSWQSDSDKKYNWYFIKECIEVALRTIKPTIEVAPRLDHDTKNEPGMIDIFSTIQAKIRTADVFVCDLTYVYANADGELCPNPNVLIELGYAMRSIGDKHIIAIMNEEYGYPDSEDPKTQLPFDLRHKRWPIKYKYGANTEKDIAKKSLVKDLSMALISSINYSLESKSISNSDNKLSMNWIRDAVLNSDPSTDWTQVQEGVNSHRVFLNEINIRLVMKEDDSGIQCEDFYARWANGFPDRHATGYWCYLYYGNALVSRTVLVSVDGGRCMLPIPREFDENQELLVVDPYDYKIAEIYDVIGDLPSYFQRSGLKLIKS